MIDDGKAPVDQTEVPPPHLAAHKLLDVQRSPIDSLRQLSFRYMRDGFSIVDLNGLHVDVNPAFCRITGFSAQELIGSRPEHFYWPPEHRKEIQSAFDKTLRGEIAELKLTFMRKNGERFPVIVDPFAIREAGGNVIYYAATVRDITLQVEIEVALRTSEARFHALFENAGDGIAIVQGDKIVDCNERLLELYNVSRDQLLGLSDFSLSPPTQSNGQDSSEYYAERLESCLSGGPTTFEWTGSKLDGSLIETEVTMTSFVKNGMVYAQCISRDISERKKMEESLRYSEVRYRTLFEYAGDAIAIMKDYQIIDCNKRLCELYSLSRDDILSTPTMEFFPPTQPNGMSSRDFFLKMITASKTSGPQNYEWHGLKRDGTPVVTEVALTTFNLGETTFEQLISRDITRRKQIEAALVELNSTLENRVVQRTQELETACAELLQRNVQYQALARKLTRAEEAERKRIARLLHDNHQQLLAAAKYRAEMLQTDLSRSKVSETGGQILEILDQALEVTRALTMELDPPILYGQGFVAAINWLGRWMEQHHELQVVVSGSLPLSPMPADISSLLFRAVKELLFNVSKHSGVEKACVSITMDKHGIEVSVTDEGVGFDVANVLQTGSYGLFSIQEQLITLEGRMDINSAPGRGTTSTLTVPMAAAIGPVFDPSPETRDTATATADVHPPLPGPIRILVADDHTLARSALVQILDLIEDFDVIGQAVDGLDAVEKVRTLRPDVILMDVGMPGLDGLEATRRIAAEFPGVKVIGLSMHAKEDMQPQMLAAGAAGYLQKPIPGEELFAAIRSLMNA